MYSLRVLRLLSVPAGNERTPRFMEKALGAIHQSLATGQVSSLEYGVIRGRVALFCRYPEELRESLITASRGQELGRGPAEGVDEEVEAAQSSLFASADCRNSQRSRARR